VGDVSLKEVVFDFLCIVFTCPFIYCFGVLWPLPFALWDLKVGYSTSVGRFEYMVESFVCVAAFLGFDKAFENCFFVVVTGEGSSISLLMEEDGAVVGCFGHDLVLVASNCLELDLGFGKGVDFV
jgi:hypothetical protein